MCQTNNWKRIEARVLTTDSFKFELIGVRSDGVRFSHPIIVAQQQEESLVSLPGILKSVVEQINEFESYRSCDCDSIKTCKEHEN